MDSESSQIALGLSGGHKKRLTEVLRRGCLPFLSTMGGGVGAVPQCPGQLWGRWKQSLGVPGSYGGGGSSPSVSRAALPIPSSLSTPPFLGCTLTSQGNAEDGKGKVGPTWNWKPKAKLLVQILGWILSPSTPRQPLPNR